MRQSYLKMVHPASMSFTLLGIKVQLYLIPRVISYILSLSLDNDRRSVKDSNYSHKKYFMRHNTKSTLMITINSNYYADHYILEWSLQKTTSFSHSANLNINISSIQLKMFYVFLVFVYSTSLKHNTLFFGLLLIK